MFLGEGKKKYNKLGTWYVVATLASVYQTHYPFILLSFQEEKTTLNGTLHVIAILKFLIHGFKTFLLFKDCYVHRPLSQAVAHGERDCDGEKNIRRKEEEKKKK